MCPSKDKIVSSKSIDSTRKFCFTSNFMNEKTFATVKNFDKRKIFFTRFVIDRFVTFLKLFDTWKKIGNCFFFRRVFVIGTFQFNFLKSKFLLFLFFSFLRVETNFDVRFDNFRWITNRFDEKYTKTIRLSTKIVNKFASFTCDVRRIENCDFTALKKKFTGVFQRFLSTLTEKQSTIFNDREESLCFTSAPPSIRDYSDRKNLYLRASSRLDDIHWR